ncbi:MAG: hydroxyacid dehydrogenase, partial [Chloroflexi bacterium]|nr:hydroxyacid dehydrogenase [Chloroflexota bacterium]
HRTVARNLLLASAECDVPYTIVSRGDSTLRGHYPDELDALGDYDATILVPFFEEGGRYTWNDVQWVREGDVLIPVAQTAYARDPMFGFAHSNLRNWIEEKTRRRIRAEDVVSIAVDALRTQRPSAISKYLMRARRQTIILNALSYRDLEVFTLALLRAEAFGKRFLVRSAASFLNVRRGEPTPTDDVIPRVRSAATSGLVIVGSHVPKSSVQLVRLLGQGRVASCELRVNEIAAGRAATEIARVRDWIHAHTRGDQHLVVYTTRAVEQRAGEEALHLGQQITSAWVEIVRNLRDVPRFMIVKGGWTASEIGTKSLGVRRAYAPAPILPGVPMWLSGEESRYPRMPYIIFPGNVGDEDSLVEVVRQLT